VGGFKTMPGLNESCWTQILDFSLLLMIIMLKGIKIVDMCALLLLLLLLLLFLNNLRKNKLKV